MKTTNSINQNFYISLYNKLNTFVDFVIGNIGIFWQIGVVFGSLALVYMISTVVKLVRNISNNEIDDDTEYSKKSIYFRYLYILHKEFFVFIFFLIGVIVLNFFNFKTNLVAFAFNFVVSSVVAKLIYIFSKKSISYKKTFALLSIAVLINVDFDGLFQAQVMQYKVFYNISVEAMLSTCFAVIASGIIFTSLCAMFDARIDSQVKLDSSAKYLFCKSFRVFLLIILSIFVLKVSNIDLKILTIFTGAIGIGLGLGLQKFAGRLTNGVMIILDNNMKNGDWVQIGAIHGVVESITTKYVYLKSFDGHVISISSEEVLKSTLVNYSKISQGRVVVEIAIESDSDAVLAVDLMTSSMNSVSYLSEKKDLVEKNDVCVKDISKHGIIIRAAFWIKKYDENVILATGEFNKSVLKLFKENGIKLYQENIISGAIVNKKGVVDCG